MAHTIQHAANSVLGADTFPPSMDRFEGLRLPSGLDYRDWARIAQKYQAMDAGISAQESTIASNRLKVLEDTRTREALEGETRVLQELDKLDPMATDYREQSFVYGQYASESPSVKRALMVKDARHQDYRTKLEEVARLAGESGLSDEAIDARLITADELLRSNGDPLPYQRFRARRVREATEVAEARKASGATSSRQKIYEGVSKDLGAARGEAQTLAQNIPSWVRENNPTFFDDFAAAKRRPTDPIMVHRSNRNEFKDRLTAAQFEKAGKSVFPDGIPIRGVPEKASRSITEDLVGFHLFGDLWGNKIKGKKDAKISGVFPLKSYIPGKVKDKSAPEPPGWVKGLVEGDKLNVGQAQKLVESFVKKLGNSPQSKDFLLKFVIPGTDDPAEDYTYEQSAPFEEFLEALHTQYSGGVLALEDLWRTFMLKSRHHGSVAVGEVLEGLTPTAPPAEGDEAPVDSDRAGSWISGAEAKLLRGD